MDLKAANYTITSRLFETGSDPTISTSDFFVSNIIIDSINVNCDLYCIGACRGLPCFLSQLLLTLSKENHMPGVCC